MRIARRCADQRIRNTGRGEWPARQRASFSGRRLGNPASSPPSWRYMIDLGATTIWERWDGWTSEHGFADDEFPQSLLPRLCEGMPLPLRARNRAGAGIGWLWPAAPPPASRGRAQLGRRCVPLRPRAHQHPLAAVRQPLRVLSRTAAERYGQRAHSQQQPRRGSRPLLQSADGYRRIPERRRDQGGGIRGRLGSPPILRTAAAQL